MPRKPTPWPELEREALADCRVFTVSRSRARSPHTGGQHDFYRIDASDWVNIVPLTEAGEVVMIRQYRHGECAVTLEIPNGRSPEVVGNSSDAGRVNGSLPRLVEPAVADALGQRLVTACEPNCKADGSGRHGMKAVLISGGKSWRPL